MSTILLSGGSVRLTVNNLFNLAENLIVDEVCANVFRVSGCREGEAPWRPSIRRPVGAKSSDVP